MKSNFLQIALLASAVVLGACKREIDVEAQAPPNPNVVPFADAALFSVDRPEQFPLAAAAQHSGITNKRILTA